MTAESLDKATQSKKVLIFDFDKTVMWAKIDWAGAQKDRYRLLYKQYPDYVRNDTKTTSTSRIFEIIAEYGMQAMKSLRPIEENAEIRNLKGFEPNPQVISFIQECYQDFEMHIWSSNTKRLIEMVLHEYALSDCFDSIVSKDVVVQRKPAPFGFFQIFDPERHALNDYLFIGDNLHDDKKAAKSVGIDFLHVDYFDKD